MRDANTKDCELLDTSWSSAWRSMKRDEKYNVDRDQDKHKILDRDIH